MTEIDISAAADDVVALLRSQRAREAAAQLQIRRVGQPLVVQEALERYVAVRAAPQLEMLGQAEGVVEADRATVIPMLERLRVASRPPRMPDAEETSALSQAQQHDVYGSMVALRGNSAAQEAMETQDRVILGLRKETRTTARRGQGEYDDRIVVLWRDAEGQGHVREFLETTTEPSAQYDGHAKTTPASPGFADVITRTKTEGEDVDADRVRDMGRLAEGTTEMRQTTHPRFEMPDDFSLRPTRAAVAEGSNRVERDTNGDGWFDARDVNGVQDLNNTFKIHRGGNENTYSAGCQTVRYEYDAFVATVRALPDQTRWHYVLTSTGSAKSQFLDASTQLELVSDPRQPGHRDHPLQQEISAQLQALGGRYAERADEHSLVLLYEAKVGGITRVDQLVASNAVGERAAGETLFIVQGRPGDPAALRVGVNAASVIETPLDVALQNLQRHEDAQAVPTLAPTDPVQHSNRALPGGL